MQSQVTPWNCYTFEKYAGDVSTVLQRSRPHVPSLAPSILNLSLAPHSEDGPAKHVQIIVWFKAPPRQPEKG